MTNPILYAVLFLAACVKPAPLLQSPINSPCPIAWENCPDGTAPGIECGSFDVPIDWKNPENTDNVSLSLRRVLAADGGKRIGNLFMNFGGPGPSSIDVFEQRALEALSQEIKDSFDIIVLDPRGVGHSSPIKCDPKLGSRITRLAFPMNDEQYGQMVSDNKAFAESCANRTGPLFAHADSVSVMKDFEALRVALGSEPFNWYGVSYGTFFGQIYASLYPQNIRAMVNDAVVDHSTGETFTLITESAAFNAGVIRFFDWCEGQAACPFHEQRHMTDFDRLIDEYNKSPALVTGCKESGDCHPEVRGYDILTTMQGALATVEAWPELAESLDEAFKGNLAPFNVTIDKTESSKRFSEFASECLDWDHSRSSLEDILNRKQLVDASATHTKGAGQAWGFQTRCIGWPFDPVVPNGRITVDKVPATLLVNSLFDPETSLVWANAVREQFGNATLIMRNGDGHGSYQNGGDTARAIDEYLLTLKVPPPNTVYQS